MAKFAPEAAIAILHGFAQLQRPGLVLPLPVFRTHLQAMAARAAPQYPEFERFLAALFPLDAFLAAACLENQTEAWETLFRARAGRVDRLLIDALRQRANRLFPNDEERQETAINDFWGHLLVAPTEESVPILRRYDGVRPLVPWLIRVFQNRSISQLRAPSERAEALLEDDLLEGGLVESSESGRWHELFAEAARGWLAGLDQEQLLLLGLRWRYRLSQREIADWYGVHEGTISRQISALREEALTQIGKDLEHAGWTEEELQPMLLREMSQVFLDEPRLSVEALARLLAGRSKPLPLPKDARP